MCSLSEASFRSSGCSIACRDASSIKVLPVGMRNIPTGNTFCALISHQDVPIHNTITSRDFYIPTGIFFSFGKKMTINVWSF